MQSRYPLEQSNVEDLDPQRLKTLPSSHERGAGKSLSPARAFVPAGPNTPPPPGHTWDSLMALALEEARVCLAAGEVPVGAVVVAPDGRLLARCGNAPVRRNDPTAHAEVLGLRAAGTALGNYRLNGCTLVVSLEPCAMCAAAIIHARLAGVVYGAADPLAGAVTSRAEYFDAQCANHRVWHMGGVRSKACAALLREFFDARRME